MLQDPLSVACTYRSMTSALTLMRLTDRWLLILAKRTCRTENYSNNFRVKLKHSVFLRSRSVLGSTDVVNRVRNKKSVTTLKVWESKSNLYLKTNKVLGFQPFKTENNYRHKYSDLNHNSKFWGQ